MAKLDRIITLPWTPSDLTWGSGTLWAVKGFFDTNIYSINTATGDVIGTFDYSCLTCNSFDGVGRGGTGFAVCKTHTAYSFSISEVPCKEFCETSPASPASVTYLNGFWYALRSTIGDVKLYKLPDSDVAGEHCGFFSIVVNGKPSWFVGNWTAIGTYSGHLLCLDDDSGGSGQIWLRLMDSSTYAQKTTGVLPLEITSLGVPASLGIGMVCAESRYFVWVGQSVNKLYRIRLDPTDDYIVIGTDMIAISSVISLTYTDTHPKERPDRFDAILAGYRPEISLGDEVVIYEYDTIVWKGILEQLEYDIDASGGHTTVIGGRDKSVVMWRKYNNRFMIEDDSGSGEAIEDGFFKNFYPHQLFKFLLYTPRCDVSDYTLDEKGELYRVGQGLDYDNMSVLQTVPDEGDGSNMIDRDESSAWQTSSNIQSGNSFKIDLGSQFQYVMGAVVRATAGKYPTYWKIQTSTNGVDWTTRDTVSGNGAYTTCFSFSPVTARYIQFVSLAGTSQPWEIFEVFIYQSLGNKWWIINNANAGWSLSFGTIDTWASTVTGGLNLNYGRLSDGLKQLMVFANQSDERWETWIDLNDKIFFGARRGSDKSGTISFSFGVNIKSVKWKKDIANIIMRLNILGKDWSQSEDGVDSGFATAGDDLIDLYGPYEKVIPPQPYPEQISAQLVRDVILTEAQNPDEILTIVVWHDMDPNVYEAGDDINVTVSHIGLNGTFRIKQRKITYDGDSGKGVMLKLGESAKFRSYKDFIDRLAWIKKRIIETDFIIPW